MEAVITVPVAFVVLLPFLFIIRSVYLYDSVQSAAYETAELMEPLFYLSTKIPEGGVQPEQTEAQTEESAKEEIASYQSLLNVLQQVGEDTGANVLVENLALQQVARYFADQLLERKGLQENGITNGNRGLSYLFSDFQYEDGERTDLFRLQTVYSLDFPFVKSFASLPPISIKVVGRKFVGQRTRGASSETDGTQESEAIYYRIQNGDHYHLGSCYLIDKVTTTLTREAAEAKGYLPCSYCNASQREIVMVTEGGTRYHASGCYHIGGAAYRVSWNEIVSQGYQPCEICIGGGPWFG